MRLSSSGIVRSPERSPASRCATGTPSLAAASVAPSVEFTSPGTTIAAGGSGSSTDSTPAMTAAVCAACEPDPTPRWWVGAGRPSCSRNAPDSERS